MTRPFRCFICALFAAAVAASEIRAQLTLPGAAPAEAQGAKVAPAKPKHKSSGASATEAGSSGKDAEATPAAGIASLAGRPLMLNGKSGLLQISGDDKSVTIDKLQLVGEGVSEMRIHVGSGYRVYYTRTGTTVYVLLAGGVKASQTKDIAKSKKMARELKRAKQ